MRSIHTSRLASLRAIRHTTHMNILAIETSCDDTAAAVVDYTDDAFDVRSNVVSSQVALHASYGGVVPNLAAREHEENIIPVLREALTTAAVAPDAIDLIAVTNGPGLIPSLIVGVSAATTLSWVWRNPLIGIHHIEGHIAANFITHPPRFPVLALVVSGGHTQLVLMRDYFQYDIIGQTLDDAVGEAFDKVARMLGLPYPGGPAIAAAAARHPDATANDIVTLPRPMLHSNNYHFSFSGIKTAVLYRIRDFRASHNLADDAPLPTPFVAAMSHAFQEAVCDVLIAKTVRAATAHNAKTVTLAGGVSANARLRTHMGAALAALPAPPAYSVPSMDYCMDNAAMIAVAAGMRYARMDAAQRAALTTTCHTLDADANLPLETH